MRDGYIRLGDPTTSGGKVTQASGFPSDGIPTALEHDKALCPLHAGEFEILGGDSGFIYNGRRSATEQLSKLACGCGLIATSADSLWRSESTPTPRVLRTAYETTFRQQPTTQWAPESTPRSSFADEKKPGPCEPLRRFTASDIRVIQSYNTIKQVVIELPPGSTKSAELHDLCEKAAAALNRAGRELESRSLCEHISFFNRIAVYMSVETVAGAKAFVTTAPVLDLVINSEPFRRLWDGHKVGVMLHEVHHFTQENRSIKKRQIDDGDVLGTGTDYEDNCFAFQKMLGFPASGYYEFDWDEADE